MSSELAAFLLGVVVAGLALVVFLDIRGRRKRMDITISQMLQLAVQGAPTGVTIVDRSGEVLLSNTPAHTMGVVHKRNLNPKVWDVVQQVLVDQEEHSTYFQIQRQTGMWITDVRAVIKPLTLVDDRYVIIYSSDESENMRMESARRDFVANVSHELKTPISSISLLAEALIEATDDPEQATYFANRLNRETHRLGDMISELISLSKLQGAEALPDLEPVAVNEIIAEAVNRNRLAAEEAHIQLNQTAGAEVTVLGDRSLLVTALSNLISNAINYSPNGKTVTVENSTVADGVVVIKVQDEGIGIAPEHQQRVFERFFRVDKARSRSTGGTGLGLAIVKHVAANHGGNIKLRSALGQGTTFCLELPIYQEQEPQIPNVWD